MTTTIKGRDYTITDRPHAEKMPYGLTGQRGAEYILSRHCDYPEILQPLPANRRKCSVASARQLGFLTDANGDLEEARI